MHQLTQTGQGVGCDERPVTALLGEATAFANEQLDAILTPAGRLMRDANAPDNDPKLHCEPYGFVREVTNALPIRIQRDGEHLLVRYEEWSLLRTIYMDGRAHPEHRVGTLLGHSVGHIEDGALVVETAQINPGWIDDSSHAAHTGALTAVERYTVHENPRRLELTLTLDDPLVSRRHAVIRVAGGKATLEDLGSKNGSFLRGERISSPRLLVDGDDILLGRVPMTFRVLPPVSTRTGVGR